MIKKRDPKKSSKLGMDINEREINAWNEAIDAAIKICDDWHTVNPYQEMDPYLMSNYLESLKK